MPSVPFESRAIDYDSVAELYDVYVGADYDFDFFRRQVEDVQGPVLELTSGTGRLSLPLLEAGAELACLDISRQMLEILDRKLKARGFQAELLCQDLCSLSIDARFELAILPFHSFMEIVGQERQRAALAAVFSALVPRGRFLCTMHNPTVRRRAVDGSLRLVGEFPLGEDRLVVSGQEGGGDPVVERLQYFECYGPDDLLRWKRLLRMEFELIEKTTFETMARETGFLVERVYGDYQGSEFDAAESPAMIWDLRRES